MAYVEKSVTNKDVVWCVPLIIISYAVGYHGFLQRQCYPAVVNPVLPIVNFNICWFTTAPSQCITWCATTNEVLDWKTTRDQVLLTFSCNEHSEIGESTVCKLQVVIVFQCFLCR